MEIMKKKKPSPHQPMGMWSLGDFRDCFLAGSCKGHSKGILRMVIVSRVGYAQTSNVLGACLMHIL